MHITVQLTPDGRRFEFELLPEGDLWFLNPTGHSRVNRCNTAGLITAFDLVKQTAGRTAPERERERRRCRLDYPWLCPHDPWRPCQNPRLTRNARALAVIATSNYEPVLQPVGQMTLFEPHVTHRRVWRQRVSGQVIDSGLRPFQPAGVVCKTMAVAAMEWLRHRQGWDPLAWQIRPLDKGHKAGEAWAARMAARYAGRYRPCTFDEF